MPNQNQWDSLKVYYRPIVRRPDFSSLSRDARWQEFHANIESDRTPLGLALIAVVNGIGRDQTHCNEVIEYLEHSIRAELADAPG